MIIGVTGKAGSGKSEATAILKAHLQANVIDLDKIGHQLLMDPQVINEIEATFGTDVIQGNVVDRKKLGAIVFSESHSLESLNSIMHPRIKSEVEKRLDESQKTVLIDGALLHEIGLIECCDEIILIESDEADIAKYAGESKRKIAHLQRSLEDYQSQATHIIKNTYDREAFRKSLAGLY
ncbi:dephospho-CoA kinase [bacterium]|jgi:dephospho-CoA kinase|nr:dephospho-CoA kinase [bacterium]